jgi:integrase
MIMAEPFKRIRNGKVRWYARYYDPDGKRVTKVFDRYDDAKKYLIKTENSKIIGSYVDPDRSKIKMADWADTWMAGQGHLKQGTRVKYQGIVDRHIKPRFGSTPLAKVSHSDVQAWVNSLGLASGSVRYVHRVFSLIMELAVRDGRIVKNPAAGVKLPRLSKSEKRSLTRDQVWALADAAAAYPIPEVGDQYKVLILLLAFTGLRWGEASGLRVRRVNLLKRQLTVAEALVEVRGHLSVSTTKSHQARTVPIPAFLVDLLTPLLEGKGKDDYVFTSWRGKPLRNLNWRRDVFDKAVADVGLEHVTPHDLRHSYASMAISAGVNLKALQRALGHSSATLTLDTYAGLFDEDLEAAGTKLDLVGARTGAEMEEARVISFPH